MATLIHEIWEVTNDRGQVLPGLVLAGPDGDEARKIDREEALNAGLAPPRCVHRFQAETHFEAMSIYYRRYGRGEYTTEFASDRQPYPEDWAKRQSFDSN